MQTEHDAIVHSAGYQQDEVLGQKASTFLAGIGTDPQAIEALEQAAIKGQDRTVELLHYKRNGSAFCNQVMSVLQPLDEGVRHTSVAISFLPGVFIRDRSRFSRLAVCQCGVNTLSHACRPCLCSETAKYAAPPGCVI